MHIGDTAKHKAPVNMKNTVYQVKRLLGRMCDDKDVIQGMNSWGFDIAASAKVPLTKVEFHSKERKFCAEEVSALILGKMKEIAENHLQIPVTQAVISVPACVNDAQRTAVKNAGTVAGFSEVALLNEPTAAAIAYNFNIKGRRVLEHILVFDLGAGTFDVSVCELRRNDVHVRASCGDAHFGGDDFDSRLVDYFAKKFLQKHGVDISQNKKAKFRLRYECEKAKKLLSASKEASIQLDCLSGDIDFRGKISRDVFEEINKDLFDIIKETINCVLLEAKMKKDHNGEFSIDQVILVGGSSRIPKIREILTDFFGQEKLNRMLNPDEAVAMGAAILAERIVQGVQPSYTDVISHSFFIEAKPTPILLFGKNSENIPMQKFFEKIFLQYTQGGTFQVLEEISKEQLLGRTFRMEVLKNSRLRISGDGIFTFNPDVLKCISDYAHRLDERQVEEMIKKADNLRNENKEWIKRSKARNDLEKLAYTVQHNASARKYRDKISSEQKKNLLSECDKTLEWIENNKTARTEEYEAQGQNLQTFWNSIFESENQKRPEEKKEDKQRTSREQLLVSNNQVEENASSLPVGTRGAPVSNHNEVVSFIEENTDVKNCKIVTEQPTSKKIWSGEQKHKYSAHFQKDVGHGRVDPRQNTSSEIHKREQECRSSNPKEVELSRRVVSRQSSLQGEQRTQVSAFVESYSKTEGFSRAVPKQPTLDEIQERENKYNLSSQIPKDGLLGEYMRSVLDKVNRLPDDEYDRVHKKIVDAHRFIGNNQGNMHTEQSYQMYAEAKKFCNSILRRNGLL